jgi:PAS domain-containing protein
MTASPPRGDDGLIPPFPDDALLEEMERIPDPAVLYRPGGRIAAVNRAAARLADFPPIGLTIRDLVGRFEIRRADGTRIPQSDLPCARALRGEVVSQGDRVVMTLPGGAVYNAIVTSTSVIVDGKVMGALSVWHDFDAYIRKLTGPPDEDGPAVAR